LIASPARVFRKESARNHDLAHLFGQKAPGMSRKILDFSDDITGQRKICGIVKSASIPSCHTDRKNAAILPDHAPASPFRISLGEPTRRRLGAFRKANPAFIFSSCPALLNALQFSDAIGWSAYT
jgi:hypothetical protein